MNTLEARARVARMFQRGMNLAHRCETAERRADELERALRRLLDVCLVDPTVERETRAVLEKGGNRER